MSQTLVTTKQYTNRLEAKMALEQFKKAMSTIRSKYDGDRADRIINSLFVDKFGEDYDISVLFVDFAAGRYDLIVGRIRQTQHRHAEARRMADQLHKELIDEMTALYCGSAA